TTQYLIDPTLMGSVVAAYSNAGLVTHYTYGLGLTNEVKAGGLIDYYDFDIFGSTIGLTDSSGGYSTRFSYLPFGGHLITSGPVMTPFQFVGRWSVMNLGTDFDLMGVRLYDAGNGAFTSADPLRVNQSALYTYARNNPIRFMDPLGLDPV